MGAPPEVPRAGARCEGRECGCPTPGGPLGAARSMWPGARGRWKRYQVNPCPMVSSNMLQREGATRGPRCRGELGMELGGIWVLVLGSWGTRFVGAEGLRAPWGSRRLHLAAQVTAFSVSKAAHRGNAGPSTPLAALRVMELPCQQDPGCTSSSPWLPSFLPFS